MVSIYEWTPKVICKDAADYLIKKLKAHGFTIMRYDSYGTNSIYLKLDEGVTGSIRISDHRGKKHLKYRYNLLIGCRREKHAFNKKNPGGYNSVYERYFFPMQDVDMLVAKCLYDRQVRVEKYGWHNYNIFREQNRIKGLQQGGFWSKARYV